MDGKRKVQSAPEKVLENVPKLLCMLSNDNKWNRFSSQWKI